MYSLILMTAMSSAPDTAEFGGFFRNLFGSGGSCQGTCYGSCAGYGSCSGRGGCDGGSGGLFGGRLRAFFSSSSCYGSCHGRSSGCYGRSYACQGSVSASCQGGLALSCQGGAFGYGPPPPLPPVDGGYAVPSPAHATYAGPVPGGFSCLGGTPLGVPAPLTDPFAAPFPTIPSGPPIPVPSSPAPGFDGVPPATPSPADPPASVPDSPSSRKFVQASGGRATVVVRLPADATLYAEGRPLALTSAERQFVTPPLPAGQEFTYSFRAEYMRDGETIAQTRRVKVRAGGTAAVEFADLTVARAPAAKPVPDVVAQPTIPFLQTAQPVRPVKATPATASEPVKPTNPFLGGVIRPSATPTPEPTDRARIIVKLPPNATLYVDGRKHERTGPTREFSTPPLPAGQEFAYLMKIETLRDGRPETLTTKVPVRAGEIVPVDFTQLASR